MHKQFEFRGTGLSFIGPAIIGWLIIVISFGLATPWAIVIYQKWKMSNTYIKGKQLKFTGSGIDLFLRWILWCVALYITLDIFYFWLIPMLQKWITENTCFFDIEYNTAL
ncbi:MAG: DUF898 family protein [Solitalea-like symbiont of Acarus siro]